MPSKEQQQRKRDKEYRKNKKGSLKGIRKNLFEQFIYELFV